MSSFPKVIIIGRMNVGKSTLFNRLSTSVKSITLDYAGVTRDFIRDIVHWQGYDFELIDSGGVSLRETEDILLEKVRHLGIKLIDEADVVIMVVDGTVGLQQEEQEIADMLHKKNKKVIIAVNKSDTKNFQDYQYEFAKMGFASMVAISAQHGIGINDLLDDVVRLLPGKKKATEEKVAFRVMFLGRPNVGKSSLLNALTQEERALVSEIPGTTREAITEKISFYQEDILLVDTPGVRRKRAVSGEIEPLMVSSTMVALKNADIVVLLLDASEAGIVDQELKLAFYAFARQYKALLLLINKSDLLTDEIRHELEHSLEHYEYFIKKIPQLEISCKTGKNVGRVLPLIKKIWDRYSQELAGQAELTQLFKEALKKRPLYHKTERLEIYKVRQINTAPITIGMQVNEPLWFGQSQRAFFENLLRSQFDLIGVPIKFVIKRKL